MTVFRGDSQLCGHEVLDQALRANAGPITLDPWDLWPCTWYREMTRSPVEVDDLHAPPVLAYELGQLAEKRAGHMLFARALHPSIPSPATCRVPNPVRSESWSEW